LVRENALTWHRFLRDGRIRRGRPDDSTWSSLEYACHVRDVYGLYRARIELMLNEQDPLFENWDQDATAVEDAYNEQDLNATIDELAAAAEALARQLDGVSGSMWQRPGRRSDGASFRVESIARYMVHDPIHHAWDVAGK